MASRDVSHDLVGREAERTVLGDVLDALVAGRPSTVLISGEAGIGKSRLLGALGATAAERGIRVLVGHCLNLETALPFSPLVEALRQLLADHTSARLADVAGASAKQLARLLPELRTVVDPGGTEDRLALFFAVADVLTKVSSSRPTILALEDVHWSDASTRDVISYITRDVKAPVGMVLTCRDTDLGPSTDAWLEELVRAVRPERLRLGPLSVADVGDLVESIAGHRPGRRQLETLTERTAGNPFFIEEVLDAEGKLPVGLLELLRGRVDRLDAVARRLVDAAAVGGFPLMDVEALAQVTGIDRDALVHPLRTVVDGGVFEVRAAEGRYAFRHGLVAEAVVAALIPDERVAWHRAWAEVLDDRDTRNPQVLGALAYHWDAAREPERALPAALAAAAAAEEVFAYPEAALQYERALRLWPEDDRQREPDRVTVLERAGIAFTLGANMSRGKTLFQEAIAGTDSRIRAGLLLDRLGDWHLMTGDEREAWEAKVRALELIPADPPSPEAARVRANTAGVLYARERAREAKPLADQAVRIAERTEDPAQQVLARCVRAEIVSRLGDFRQAQEDLERATLASQRADVTDADESPREREERHLLLLTAEIKLLADRGEYEDGLEVARDLLGPAQAAGTELFEGRFARFYSAWFAFQLGRWQRCERLLAHLVDMSELGHNQAHIEGLRLDFEVATGQFSPAAERVERNRRNIVEADVQALSDFARSHAELELWQQRATDALRVCTEVLDVPTHDGSEHLTAGVLATALRARADLRGRPDPMSDLTAEALLDRLLAATASHERGEVVAWRATGQAEFARARGGQDPEVWDRAVRSWDELNVPYRAVYCRYRQAEAILHSRGGNTRARNLLTSAHGTAADLGARPLQDEIEQLARRARLDLHDATPAAEPPPEHPDPLAAYALTGREREVLALLAEGSTNAEIARRLFVTEKTVEGHVSNVLRKLGVANRVQAATIFQRLSG